LLATLMPKIIVPGTVLLSAMFAEPKAIERALDPAELKEPTLRALPFRSSVPSVRKNVLPVPTLQEPFKVTVIPVPLISVLASVFPAPVSVADVIKYG